MNKRIFAFCVLLTTVTLANADWVEQTSVIETRGLLQSGAVMVWDKDQSLPNTHPHSLLNQDARLMITADPTPHWSAELHAIQAWGSTTLDNTPNLGPERSASLHWQTANNRVSASLDRLNLQYQSGFLTMKAGRFPVNLSRTSYFSPFDWFAPFSAETFYRVYKPGVDAWRLDLAPAGLSHFSLLQVQGYQPDPASSNGWSPHPDHQNRSSILQLGLSQGDFQWDILVARVRGQKLFGAALQGEPVQWLGLRAEGYRASATQQNAVFNELTLELEHRFANSLTVHLATFWHGAGAHTASAYPAVIALAQTNSPYLANRYLLVAVDYDLTPLLTTNALLLQNTVDHSLLLALYARYSTSDESELTLGLNLPVGLSSVINEFSNYPQVLNVQFRYYF